MRKTMLFLPMFTLTCSLWAADPIIGTWKLNIVKSTFSPVALALQGQKSPKETTEVYREEGDLIEMSDGLPNSDKWTWSRQGGVANRKPPVGQGLLYIETLIEPGHWIATILMNGKQVAIYHKVIDKDGKTMRQTFKGVDPDGKPFEQIQVYDKQ